MKLLIGVALLACLAFSQARVDKFERLKLEFERLAELMKSNETLRELWKEHMANFTHPQTRAYPHKFHCHTQITPHPTPHSVHELRVEDFKVVAAMGDSITAANGAKASTVLGVLTEYRGVSWSIGGDHTLDTGVTTMANILKKYNPNIRGYSTGSGSVNGASSHLNVAHPGDTSHDMPHQANLLISRMKADHHINFEDDWKLVTLFIGGNDLCDVCHDHNKYSGTKYRDNIRHALDILHAGMPRTFVNLAMIFDITPVAMLGHGHFFCNIVHNMVCDCGQDTKHHAVLQTHLADYQRLTQELIDSGRYDAGRQDFTVVLQPFFEHTLPPRHPSGAEDLSYFAPDCFHFSQRGHEAAGVSLFNNMIEPIGHKSTSWHLDEPFLCPGHHSSHINDFIPTYKNRHVHNMVGK